MRLDATSIAEFEPTEFEPEADNQSVAVADPADDMAEQVPFDEDQEPEEPEEEQESAGMGDTEPADSEEPVAGDESNDAYRLRTITIPIPPELETSVIFLIRNDADKWLPGYKVDRTYDTSPHDSTLLEYLDSECETMADAIGIACDRANYFICTNSADDDAKAAKAGEILDNWYNEMAAKAAEDGITEDIFDKETNEDVADVAVIVANQPETPTDQSQTASELAENSPVSTATPTPGPSDPAARYEVTDEAHRVWEDRKNDLAFQIAESEIEIAELKNRVKNCQKFKDETRKELEEHISSGPERLPLFDKPLTQPTAVIPASFPTPPAPPAETQTNESASTPAGEMNADNATSSTSTESTGPIGSESTGPISPAGPDESESGESWRDITIAELDGLTEKIVDVLHEHDIITLGNWVDLPKNRGDGFEYTQLKGITEKRLEKIQDAMEKVYG